MIRKFLYKTVLLAFAATAMIGCKEEEYSAPVPKSGLQNDCIKKSIGPNMRGVHMEFIYAMAIQKAEGRLVSAKVEASIPGVAAETYIDNKSYYTSDEGSNPDIGVPVADPSVTNGAVTEINFNVDTNASTLRYYYMPSEDAVDKEVSFTFTATSSNGQTVTYKMGPYKVRRMERALQLTLTDNNKCYISIEDMAVYNAAEAAARPEKIDLVYLYRELASGARFGHSFAAPAASDVYLPGVTLPAGVDRNARIIKTFGIRDLQLVYDMATLGNNTYIYLDDPDFSSLNFSNTPNYAIYLLNDAGMWVETEDGQYRAFIFVNKIDNANKSAVIGIKRFKVQ